MSAKFSEDVVPLSELERNPGKVISRAQETHRPILLTSSGRGVAVVQGLEDFERAVEELQFAKAVALGLADVCEGNTVSLVDARQQMDMEASIGGKIFTNHSAGQVEDWKDSDEDEIWT